MIEQIGNWGTQIFWVVFILGLCIFSHELGHFIAAKLSRMRVKEFAFGLGPLIKGLRWGETTYAIRAIPFGGMVDIAGMEPGEPDVPGGFHTRPRWQRFVTIFAGVLMNVVLAMVLFWVINVFHGVPIADSRAVIVGKVMPRMPAEAAGLQTGDEIVAVDGNQYGLQVASVEPGSPADQVGITPGYFILSANGKDVAVPTGLIEVLQQAETDNIQIGALDPGADSLPEAIVTARLPRMAEEGQISALFGGKMLDLRAAPEIKADISMGPLREVFEQAGGVLQWFPQENKVHAVNEELDISLQIGNPFARVNDQKRQLALAPYIKRGRTMVPLRFLDDILDVAISPSQAITLAHQHLGLTFRPLDQSTVVRYLSLRPGAQVNITVARDNSRVNLTVSSQTVWGRLETITAAGQLNAPHREIGRIGVLLSPPTQRVGILKGLVLGAKQSVAAVVMVIQSVQGMITRKITAEPVGPIGITVMIAEQAQAGWATVLSWGGIISANLAVINLIPIPPFDGFHIVLISYEGIIRRRIRPKPEMAIRLAGIFLVLVLFAWLMTKDVINLWMYGTP